MRAEEQCLTWQETEALINDIKLCCDNYKCDLLKQLLLAAPAGYISTEKLCDAVWVKRNINNKLRLV